MALFASAASADFTGPGTAHLDNGPITLSCGNSASTVLFVINQIDPTGSLPHTIQITFQTNGGGTTTLSSTGFSSQGNGQNFHYTIDLPGPSPFSAITDATVTVPNGTSIGQFVWSHTDCAKAPSPPPPGPTPELESILLLGAGISGLGAYGLLRMRSRRRH